jgi:hypothetical protein
MLAVSSRILRALTASGAFVALTSAAQAQFWDPCNACAAPPVTVMANPCQPCMQRVTTMEERQVQVTAYVDEERTVKVPKVETVTEQVPVTAYRTEMETRTAEVPGIAYQQCTECQQVTQNRSYWQTYYQPVPKMSPCQYDPRPGFAGAFNRAMYSSRMAFTPNYIPHRQYVPNVVAYNVPVTRTVAVPTSRTVAYNVAKLVPYETTRPVARNVVTYEERTVTVKVPRTETRTVQVPTTRWAYVDSFGGGSVSAARPTPAIKAEADQHVKSRTAEADKAPATESPGNFKPLSYPRPKTEALPRDLEVHSRPAPAPAPTEEANVTALRPVPSAVRVANWQPTRHAVPQSKSVEGPRISVAAR